MDGRRLVDITAHAGHGCPREQRATPRREAPAARPRPEPLEFVDEPRRTGSILVPDRKHRPAGYWIGPPLLRIQELASVANRSAA